MEAQLRPDEGTSLAFTFEILEDVFTGLFALEIVIGWSADWCLAYLQSSWNVFNLLIILLSFWSAVYPNAPAFHAIRAVRVMRATKLLAYFGKLREIVAGEDEQNETQYEQVDSGY